MPFFVLAMAWIIGVGMQELLALESRTLTMLSIVAIVFSFAIISRLIIESRREDFVRNRMRAPWHRSAEVCIVVSAGIIAALTYQVSRETIPADDVRHLDIHPGDEVEFTGWVEDAPLPRNSESGYDFRSRLFVLELAGVNAKDGHREVTGMVEAYAGDEFRNPPLPGEFLRIRGVWSEFSETEGTRGMSARDFKFSRGIFGRVRLRIFDGVQSIDPPSGLNLGATIKSARMNVTSRLMRDFDRRVGGLYAALLVGERRFLTEDVTQKFESSGTVHLLAVSGLHVIAIGSIFGLFFRGIGMRGRTLFAFTSAVLIVYAFAAGARISVIRAATGAVIYAFAALIGRSGNGFNVLGFIALMFLVPHPEYLFDIGFQLSFAAVFSILLLSTMVPLGNLLPVPEGAKFHERLFLKFTGSVLALILVSIAVMIGTTPLTLYHFNFVTPGMPLFNVVAIPALTIVLLGGVLYVFLIPVIDVLPMSDFIIDALSLPAKALLAILELFAGMPGSSTYGVGLRLPFVVAMMFLLLLVLFRTRRGYRAAHVTMFVLAALLLTVVDDLFSRARNDTLRVTAIPVDHGNSLLIEAPGDQVLLYDAGSLGNDEVGANTIAPALFQKRIDRIDVLFFSHIDADHTNGFEQLLRRFTIGGLVVPQNFARFDRGNEIMAECDQRGIPVMLASTGSKITGVRDVAITALHPPGFDVLGTELDSNDSSLALLIESAGRKIVLTGDLEERGAFTVLRYVDEYLDPPVDLLVVPHHGRDPMVCGMFLEALRPKSAIVSTSRDTFSAEMAAEYRRAGVDLRLTSSYGLIEYSAAENGFVQSED
ncbi:MAG: DNA internalization-related competence protein ComEC/Rec2 [Planctomycetes bacterium]|nr:DNA internalization-related competence protein ComEC/Rec2 [Planctomycetota bacterium]